MELLILKESTEKFHQLQKVYEVLIDEEKRKVYDETGQILSDETLSAFTDKNFDQLYTHFRALFKKINEDDIRDFEVPPSRAMLMGVEAVPRVRRRT